MFVDRKKIRLGSLTSGASINIPIKLDFLPVENGELIKDKFVRDEVEKSINPIIDYKKVRFKPAVIDVNGKWVLIDEFKIELNFFTKSSIFLALYSGGTYEYNNTIWSTTTNGVVTEEIGPRATYGNIGFSDEDLFCRVSKLMNSYLTFNFYDSPNPASNNLILFTNIFTQILDEQKDIYGIPLLAFDGSINSGLRGAPITFRLGDPTLKPDSIHEGFHIYWYEDLVKAAPNNEYTMYLSPTYQNAGNGETSIMYPVKTTINATTKKANINLREISGEEGVLYIKVILKYDTSDGLYKYTIKPTNDRQKKINNGGLDWTTTNPNKIATLRLWQLTPNDEI